MFTCVGTLVSSAQVRWVLNPLFLDRLLNAMFNKGYLVGRQAPLSLLIRYHCEAAEILKVHTRLVVERIVLSSVTPRDFGVMAMQHLVHFLFGCCPPHCAAQGPSPPPLLFFFILFSLSLDGDGVNFVWGSSTTVGEG